MTLRQVAIDRLAEIDCKTIPTSVRDAIVSDFVAIAEAKLTKLASRHISRSKVARAFVNSQNKKGCHIDLLHLPPEEGGTYRLAGTPLLEKILQ